MKTTTNHRVEFENGIPRVYVAGGAPEGLLIERLIASGDNNTKTRKNVGYTSAGMSMAPHRAGGIGNVCASASPVA